MRYGAATLILVSWMIGAIMGGYAVYASTRGEECHLLEERENPFDMVNRSGHGWYVHMIHAPPGAPRSVWQLCRHR